MKGAKQRRWFYQNHLDNFGGSDEVDGVVVMFLHTRTDGEDVGVKNDVVGVKSNFVD